MHVMNQMLPLFLSLNECMCVKFIEHVLLITASNYIECVRMFYGPHQLTLSYFESLYKQNLWFGAN